MKRRREQTLTGRLRRWGIRTGATNAFGTLIDMCV